MALLTFLVRVPREVELLIKNLAKLNSDMECPGIQGGLDRHSMAMSHEVVGIFVSSTSN